MPAPLEIRRREPVVPEPAWPQLLAPLLRRIYARRGITSAQELDSGLAQLQPFHAFKGIDKAAALLQQALEQSWHILIAGDFDADGATASALAVHALRRMGAAKVSFVVPDRFVHGYGLSPELVALAQQNSPDLIITVDNGISSVAGVAAAKAAGIRVLITDHHLPGPELPAADAVVNPNQAGCEFASRNVAGVGVIFYVLTALRARLREQGWFDQRPQVSMADYLDLVALGTVADVVPLDHNNRILISQGLARIRAGYARPGIRALAQVAGREPAELVAADIGFGLAPRLNAAGRLQDMGLGVACLLAQDEAEALALARQLNALNLERRERQQQMQEEALATLDDSRLNLEGDLPLGLCVHEPDWHEGIVGLVAGRVRERYSRPAIAFAKSAVGSGMLKGSARSIPGVHIRDVLAAIDAANPGLIERFGGHAMAAGLSLRADHYVQFSGAFAAQIGCCVTSEQLKNVVVTDGELLPNEFTLETATLLRAAGPWGQGFPEPCFDGFFNVLTQRIVGEHHTKLRLQPANGEKPVEAIAFNYAEPLPQDRPVCLVYRLDINAYRGQRSVQIIVTHVVDGAANDVPAC